MNLIDIAYPFVLITTCIGVGFYSGYVLGKWHGFKKRKGSNWIG